MTKKWTTMIMFALLPLWAGAQMVTDTRCLDLMGIPLEGPVDTLVAALKQQEFAEWGHSDDGEDLYFRGKYYGIRAKLMVTIQPATRLVRSAYVTVGSYRTKEMLQRNMSYFVNKLAKVYGSYSTRGGAYYFFSDYGNIKVSEVQNSKGSSDINIFYLPTMPYFKDATLLGLKGHVQEVVTENPVAENGLERFAENGKTENPDVTGREYNQFGYLVRAQMLERQGMSLIEYEYDKLNRLARRTLRNDVAGIIYVNEYTYTENNEILNQSQKVFDKSNVCLMSINMHNSYEAHDDEGNWTRNQLSIVYWEKDSQSQSTSVVQTRRIRYWDE